jgi:hypothetical protein
VFANPLKTSCFLLKTTSSFGQLLEFSQKKMADERVENKNFKTGIYNMNVNIIYEDIILKLNEAKQIIGVLSP